MFSEEKQSQRTGAGMRTDDGADLRNEREINVVALFDYICERPDILFTVGMGDEDGGGEVVGKFGESICQRFKRFLFSAGGADFDEFPFVVYFEDGLDPKQTAHKSHGGADASASLQVFQIIDREPDA